MVAADDAPNYARRLGIQKDQVVQELGWDEDSDDDIRADIEEACGGELLDEDADEVIDVVFLWWRDGDGDLVDRLMDAIVRTYIACQMPDGYLGTYLYKDRWTEWDVWAHKYAIIGLLNYYAITGYKPALETARRAADLCPCLSAACRCV